MGDEEKQQEAPSDGGPQPIFRILLTKLSNGENTIAFSGTPLPADTAIGMLEEAKHHLAHQSAAPGIDEQEAEEPAQRPSRLYVPGRVPPDRLV